MNFLVPKEFLDKYLPIADQPDSFTSILTSPPQKSFRINPLKGVTDEVLTRLKKIGITCNSVPWYKHAFTHNVDNLSSSLDRFTGNIYIQELASMLPPLIAEQELQQAETVLDCCAAPGSKTTLIAALMNNKNSLIANDRSYIRIRGLKFNIDKSGVTNTLVTNFPLKTFPDTQFDLVMLDAPCSSDGTVRKNPNLFQSWTPKRCRSYASRQKQLILQAFDLLHEDGILIYSTCSFAPEENELVINKLLSERDAALLPISLSGFHFSPALTEWEGYRLNPEIAKCVRVWPQMNNTDGFFIAKVQK